MSSPWYLSAYARNLKGGRHSKQMWQEQANRRAVLRRRESAELVREEDTDKEGASDLERENLIIDMS